MKLPIKDKTTASMPESPAMDLTDPCCRASDVPPLGQEDSELNDEPQVVQCPNCNKALSEVEIPRHFDFVFATGELESFSRYQSITLEEDVEDTNQSAHVALILWLTSWRHLKRQFFDNPDIDIISLAEMPQLIYSPRGEFVVLDLLRTNTEIEQVQERPDLWRVNAPGGIAE